jgi:hypothetical protein
MRMCLRICSIFIYHIVAISRKCKRITLKIFEYLSTGFGVLSQKNLDLLSEKLHPNFYLLTKTVMFSFELKIVVLTVVLLVIILLGLFLGLVALLVAG